MHWFCETPSLQQIDPAWPALPDTAMALLPKRRTGSELLGAEQVLAQQMGDSRLADFGVIAKGELLHRKELVARLTSSSHRKQVATCRNHFASLPESPESVAVQTWPENRRIYPNV